MRGVCLVFALGLLLGGMVVLSIEQQLDKRYLTLMGGTCFLAPPTWRLVDDDLKVVIPPRGSSVYFCAGVPGP